MDRRSFFKRTAGIAMAPFAVKLIKAETKKPAQPKMPSLSMGVHEKGQVTTLTIRVTTPEGIAVHTGDARADLIVTAPHAYPMVYELRRTDDGCFEADVHLLTEGMYDWGVRMLADGQPTLIYQGRFEVRPAWVGSEDFLIVT